MTYRIYLSPPDVGHLEEEYALDAMRSGWVAPLGPHVDAFERELAAFVGARHAVALTGGTAGLHLALLAVGVRPGQEVIVPSLTFAAPAFAVTYVGAAPVFMDSEPTSWNLDPDLLAHILAGRARRSRPPAAVIAVDLFGQVADFTRIEAVCAEYGIPLVEDAAEALGATCGRRMAGTFGRAAVLSFNGNKIMTTGGGGMLVTQDGQIAERVRFLAAQARERVDWYEHEDIGYNYRLSNVLAAVGRAQLQRLPQMLDRRRAIRARYAKLLADIPGVTLPDEAPWGETNNWLAVVVFDDPAARACVQHALKDRGIESRRAWKPMHMQPVFANSEATPCPVSEKVFERTLCLPSGSQLEDEQIDEITEAITAVLEGTP